MRQMAWPKQMLLETAPRLDALLHSLQRDAPSLGISVTKQAASPLLIDCGIDTPGSWEAGRRLVEICHGGMARARLDTTDLAGWIFPSLLVDSWLPARSTLGLQLSLPLSEISDAIRVSGPIRAAFATSPNKRGPLPLAWRTAVVESDRRPSLHVARAVATRAGLSTDELVLVVVPPGGPTGSTQIAGRGNESVLFTLQESLKIDAACVSAIAGSVPIAPAADPHIDRPDFPVLPDDFIHYAGMATVSLRLPSGSSVSELADQLVFRSCKHHGRLFAELLAAAGGVFEAIPDLTDVNKIAQITVHDVATGAIARAGTIEPQILLRAWAGGSSPTHEGCSHDS